MAKFSIRLPKRRWPKIIVAAAGVGALIVIGTVAVIHRVYNENLKPLSSSRQSHFVTIPAGASVKEAALILKKADLIREAWAFEWYMRNNNLRDKLQAGTYSLRPNLSIPEIAEVLTRGKVATDLVTILPAQRIDQIKEAFINKYSFEPADVEKAFDPNTYIDHPALVDKPRGASLEGYLYPESFQKTATTKPEVIIRASLDEMQKYLTPELRSGIVKQGLTVHEGVILASVVENEVGNKDDRPKVAQVFLRRLREGIALESDATTAYGAVLDNQTPSPTYKSPYNTYLNKALPPGPISNVSQSSLQAIAGPAPTDFLYFVSGDDGVTYFSHTLEEHEALAKEHCKKLCSN